MKQFLTLVAGLVLLSGLALGPTPAQAAPKFQTVSRRAHSARHHHAHKAAKHHRTKHRGTV